MWADHAYRRQHPEQTFSRCYDEDFDPEKYRLKTTEDLVSWARNIRAKILELLPSDPYPAELVEKLTRRYDGIMTLVRDRRKKRGAPTDDKELRAQHAAWLKSTENDDPSVTNSGEDTLTPSPGDICTSEPSAKRSRTSRSTPSPTPTKSPTEKFSFSETVKDSVFDY